ncbi:MAG: LuxR C-terminal-related transcriptional regulator [Phycisphaerales bacterium JB063]
MVVDTLESLTPREREVLTLVAQGLSLPEIAQKLHRSLKTIETHRLSLGRKLDASNRVELTRIAIASGLAPIEVSIAESQAESAKISSARRELEGRSLTLRHFQQINDEVFSATGPSFLRRLVLSLTRVLGVRSATICALSYEGGEQVLQTLALCNQGVMLDPEKYFARFTPCEDVLLSGRACFVGGLAKKFPQDTYLDELGDQSYIGVRLEDQQGNAIGLMSVLDDQQIANPDHIDTILSMFAPRAAAELTQLAISDRVRELSEDLESEVEKRTQELGQANSIFHSLVSRSADGFCGVDDEGLIMFINASLAETLERNAGDLMGKVNVIDLVYPDDRADFACHIYQETKARTNMYHVRLLHADGSPVGFDVVSHAQLDESGRHLGCFAVLTQDDGPDR